MKRFILPGIILIIFHGCISSPGKNYYQLHMKCRGSVIKIGKILLVESVDVDPIYNDYRMVYRLSPYELNYYSYKFWIKKPGQMMRDAIFEYLSKKNIFDKVLKKFSDEEPDFLLKAKLNALEEYDLKETWFARLNMEIEIKNHKTGNTVLTHNFDRKKRIYVKKVGRVPIALSIILEEELANAVNKLAEKLK